MYFGTDSTAFEKEAVRLSDEIAKVEREEGVKVDSISRDIILRKMYETFYGIYNHYSGKTKPLDVVTARQKEEVYLYSKRVKDIERYIELGVHAATGISMDKFFELPVADAEFIFSIVARRNKGESTQAKDLETQLKKAMDSAGSQKKT